MSEQDARRESSVKLGRSYPANTAALAVLVVIGMLWLSRLSPSQMGKGILIALIGAQLAGSVWVAVRVLRAPHSAPNLRPSAKAVAIAQRSALAFIVIFAIPALVLRVIPLWRVCVWAGVVWLSCQAREAFLLWRHSLARSDIRRRADALVLFSLVGVGASIVYAIAMMRSRQGNVAQIAFFSTLLASIVSSLLETSVKRDLRALSVHERVVPES